MDIPEVRKHFFLTTLKNFNELNRKVISRLFAEPSTVRRREMRSKEETGTLRGNRKGGGSLKKRRRGREEGKGV